MASQQAARRRRTSAAASNMILKEGYLCKRGGVLKNWSRRYFVLNHQCLVYFKRALSPGRAAEEDSGLHPMGRVFLSDVTDIQTEVAEKKRAFVFSLHTKKRDVLLQASNNEDRDKWVLAVRQALETDKKAEREDPFRKTLRRLKQGLKRVTLIKDPVKGIGCTIKSAAGHIFVNRIIEDGPIAHTGVLRPGDEILDIHGTPVGGMQVSEVVEVIKQVPNQFLATVRPLTSISKNKVIDTGSVNYSEIRVVSQIAVPSHPPPVIPEILISEEPVVTSPTNLDCSPSPSLDDVGYYDDDEEEEDTPPPVPPRTEEALIIVEPFTQNQEVKPALPPKPPSYYSNSSPPLSSSSLQLVRPNLTKSKSEDSIARRQHNYEEMPGIKKSTRPQRHHDYEEIQPALNYMDIRMLDFTKSKKSPKNKSDSLVKVEIDMKRKVHV